MLKTTSRLTGVYFTLFFSIMCSMKGPIFPSHTCSNILPPTDLSPLKSLLKSILGMKLPVVLSMIAHGSGDINKP